jgi:NADH-quinone oxidoreductase subunit D
MDRIEELLRDMERALLHNAVFKRRSVGLGVITNDMMNHYGVTGPNARAAGITRDIRLDQPYLMYDRLDLDYITAENSDAYDRTKVRLGEMFQSVSLIRQMLDAIPGGGAFHTRLPNPLHWKVPPGETYRRAECTRGEYGYYMVSDGSAYPRRICVRGPSYTHAVALMEEMAVGVNIADIAGLMTSLHTYPPEIER